MRINRIDLMKCLQTVEPGLSNREIVEQSSCFIFKDGEVLTFNGDIACRVASPFDNKFTGAVVAKPLLAILNKMAEKFVDVEMTESELHIVGKKRDAGIRLETEITLPLNLAETPGDDWTALHPEFIEAVSIVQECASRDESKFSLTCVHVTPKWIEACDNFQLTRYKLKTGIKENILIKKDSLKHIVLMEVTEFSETNTWIHFRNSDGLMLSCRRFIEQFHDLDPLLDCTGQETQLPKGLDEAAERAEVFSGENADNNQIRIDIRPGKMRIKGVGNSGWYREYKSINYKGPNIVFMVSPKLLRELVKKHTICEVSSERLKVNGGKWTYVACLVSLEEAGNNGTPDERKKVKRKKDVDED